MNMREVVAGVKEYEIVSVILRLGYRLSSSGTAFPDLVPFRRFWTHQGLMGVVVQTSVWGRLYQSIHEKVDFEEGLE